MNRVHVKHVYIFLGFPGSRKCTVSPGEHILFYYVTYNNIIIYYFIIQCVPWTTTDESRRRSTLGPGPAPVPGPSGYRAIATGGLWIYFYILYALLECDVILYDNNPYPRQKCTHKCDVKSILHFKYFDMYCSAENIIRSNTYLIIVKS